MPKKILTVLTIYDNNGIDNKGRGDGRGDFDLGRRILAHLKALWTDQVINYVIIICPALHQYIKPDEFQIMNPNVVFIYKNKKTLDEELTQLFSSESIRDAIKDIDCMISLSCRPPKRIFSLIHEVTEGQAIKNYCMGEHGAVTFDDSFISDNIIHVPSSLGYINGFLFDEIVPPLSLETRAQILFEITDKVYLSKLLSCSLEELSLARAMKFLRNNFFVPGYIQDESVQMLFIQLMANSNIVSQYAGLTFHMNRLINFDGWKQEVLSQLGEAGFLGIFLDETFYETGKHENISGKIIRILTDTRLSDEDYRRVYAASSGVIGCSGDNTLEKVMSLTCFPFINVRKWKRKFMSGFLDFLQTNLGDLPSIFRQIVDIQGKKYVMQLDYKKEEEEEPRTEVILRLSDKITESNIDGVRNSMNFLQNHCNFSMTTSLWLQKILHPDEEVLMDMDALLVVNWRKNLDRLADFCKKHRENLPDLSQLKEKFEILKALVEDSDGLELDLFRIYLGEFKGTDATPAKEYLNNCGPIFFDEAWRISEEIIRMQIEEEKIKTTYYSIRIQWINQHVISMLRELVHVNIEFPGKKEIEEFLESNPNKNIYTIIPDLMTQILQMYESILTKVEYKELHKLYLALRVVSNIGSISSCFDFLADIRAKFNKIKNELHSLSENKKTIEVSQLDKSKSLFVYSELDEDAQRKFPRLLEICGQQYTHQRKKAVQEMSTGVPYILKNINKSILVEYGMRYQADHGNSAAIEAFCGELFRAMLPKIHQPKYKYITDGTPDSESTVAVEYLEDIRNVVPNDFYNYNAGLAGIAVLSMLLEEWDLKLGNLLFDPRNMEFIRVDTEWCLYSLREPSDHPTFSFHLTEEDIKNLPCQPQTYLGFKFLESEPTDEVKFEIPPSQLIKLSTSPEFIQEKYETLLAFMLFPKELLHLILLKICDAPESLHTVEQLSIVLSVIERRQTEIKQLLQNDSEFQEFCSAHAESVIVNLSNHLHRLYHLNIPEIKGQLEAQLAILQITAMEISEPHRRRI